LRSITFLLLLAGSAAAQTPRPFSHRLHLRLKLECTECHAAARASTRVEDNLLPRRDVCLRCHQNVMIPPPPTTLVNRFSHQLHLKFGNMAPLLARAIDTRSYLSPPADIRRHLNGKNPCGACHRGLEESDAVTRAALPQMADCLVCHVQIDPPYTCEFCHSKTAKLKPANHTADFLDAHTRKNAISDKSSCAVCHSRKFTCLGCH
jgi:predicted CXXCH cytochrome family protein